MMDVKSMTSPIDFWILFSSIKVVEKCFGGFLATREYFYTREWIVKLMLTRCTC